MELDELKSMNQAFEQDSVSKENLSQMMQANTHPSLRSMHRQLTIESIGWTIFLSVYYNFFDGHLKPMCWNVLLVLAVGLLLVHNLLGYRISSQPIHDVNILDSLEKYLKRIRTYAYVSIGTRVLAILMMFGFFLSSIEVIESRHAWSLLGVLSIVGVQIYMLWRVWSKRIRKIADTATQVRGEG